MHGTSTAARRAALLAIAALAATAAVVWPARAADDVRLSWTWKPGRVLRYRLVQDLRKFKRGDEGEESFRRCAVEWREEAKTVTADGRAAVEVRYERVELVWESRSKPRYEYDSSKPEDAAKATVQGVSSTARLLTRALLFECDARGAIRDLRSADGSRLHTLDLTVAYSKADPLAVIAEDPLSGVFAKGATRLPFEGLPPGPIANGFTWTHEFFSTDRPSGALSRVTNRLSVEGSERIGGLECVRVAMDPLCVKSADGPIMRTTAASAAGQFLFATAGYLNRVTATCTVERVLNIKIDRLGPPPAPLPPVEPIPPLGGGTPRKPAPPPAPKPAPPPEPDESEQASVTELRGTLELISVK